MGRTRWEKGLSFCDCFGFGFGFVFGGRGWRSSVERRCLRVCFWVEELGKDDSSVLLGYKWGSVLE